MRYLTKSRYATAITCPRKLAFLDDDRYINSNKHNEFLLALADGGNQVGALAKCLFPDGIEVESSGHDAQVEETTKLLERSTVTIFEAAIRVGRLFIRIDLLHKNGNKLELFEVKAKSYDSNEGRSSILKKTGIGSEFKPYIYDIAFQRHVLRLAFPEMEITTHLVMPDKSKTCTASGIPQLLEIVRSDSGAVQIRIDGRLRNGDVARQILAVVPADEFIDALVQLPVSAGGYHWQFEESIKAIEGELDEATLAPVIGAHCKSCEFRATTDQLPENSNNGAYECWEARIGVSELDIESGTIFDLANFRHAESALTKGRFLLRDLDQEDLKYKADATKISTSHRQWLQCKESRREVTAPVLMRREIEDKLSQLTFPLHFIDFETATPPIPFHAGMRPYEMVLFQFSHHLIDHDGRIAHISQSLEVDPLSFPNFNIVRALKTAIGEDGGSVVHWWTHEQTTLKKIRDQLLAHATPPADRDQLVAFIDDLVGSDESPGRLVDLGQHIVHQYAYFTGTKGSSSIKKILPAVLKASPNLQSLYRQPSYGTPSGISSLNFSEKIWVELDESGQVKDPYTLLPSKFDDADLDTLDGLEDSANHIVSNGGAAMVAYGLLQNGTLHEAHRANLISQLFRYCELDTLAMVIAYQGLRDLLRNPA